MDATNTNPNNEMLYQTYDKSVNYKHERTNFPPTPPKYPYYHYEEYERDRLTHPPTEISPRSYPESDYYQRTQQVHRPLDYSRSADAASAHRTEKEFHQRYYDEERAAAQAREQRELAAHHEASRSAAKNGYSHGYSHKRSGWGASGHRGGKPTRQHHRITCLCCRFYWPPWGFEPCEPVQPWYPRYSPEGSPRPIDKQPR